MSELYLIVLWEKARAEEERILADVRRHVTVVARTECRWPGDAKSCFARFYGAKASLAAGKEKHCGGGPFLLLIVRDDRPRYGWRRTSRGTEYVNLRIFAMKSRYRGWTGGGHKVHATNSTAETRRDVFLLTGRTLESWRTDPDAGVREVLPGRGGWSSLRALFAALEETVPYLVLRNFECLPDAFDPSLHGDIDLLVADEVECAGVLGARRVRPEPWRVHYEVRVGGRPVRFDFRHVGDGYYDARWQRDMLSRSVLTADGVRIPAPRDAFFSLVYHALVQKREVASDYLGKAMDLSRAAGIAVDGFDAAFTALEEFLSANGYGAPRPSDKSVFYDADLLRWREVASDCAASLPVKALRPVRTDARHADSVRHALHFTGETAEGAPCAVDYLTTARETAETDWSVGRLYQSRFPRHAVKILFYRLDRHAERHGVVVREAVKGRTFAEAVAAGVSPERAADLARELTAIGRELAELGLCHRDLGPETLWVADDGSVKISSFRFAVKIGDGRETQFLSKRWKALVALGGACRAEPGVWNDRLALADCLERLGDFPGKDDFRAALDAGRASVRHVVRFRSRYMTRLRLLKWRFVLWNGVRRLLGKSAKQPEVQAFLANACSKGVR